MTTIIIIAAVMVGVWIFFKRWAKNVPAKRTREEIATLEADLGDTLVDSMKKDYDEKKIEDNMKRLKTLWRMRDEGY